VKLVVRGHSAGSPDITIVILVTHRPVHLTIRVLGATLTPFFTGLLSPLDFVYAFVVDVYSGNGITSLRALAQGTVRTGVSRVTLAFNSFLFVPCTVVSIRYSHVNTLTMSTATVGAGDTSATLTFETRETRTLASAAIANSLVAALAVEVSLVPCRFVVLTSETVSGIVLFANETVGVLVLDLLVRVDPVIGVNITKWRVDERFSIQAQTI